MGRQNGISFFQCVGLFSVVFFFLLSTAVFADNSFPIIGHFEDKEVELLAFHQKVPKAGEAERLLMQSDDLKVKKNISIDGRFIDNKDGTILDTKTNLIWTRTDSFAELGKCKNWNDSKEYVKELSTAGYTDWRMPTAEELKSLFNFSKWNKDYAGGTIHIDPIFPSGGAWRLWASDKAGSCCARRLSFSNGLIGKNLRSYCGDEGVRAVRSILDKTPETEKEKRG